MANKKITDLTPAATRLVSGDLLEGSVQISPGIFQSFAVDFDFLKPEYPDNEIVYGDSTNGSDSSSDFTFDVSTGTFSLNGEAQINGLGVTSATYSMRINDNSSNPILYVQDNRYVGIRYATPDAPLHIECTTTSGIKMLINGGNPDRYNIYVAPNEELYFDALNSAFHFRGNGSAATDYFYMSGAATGNGAGRVSSCYSGSSGANYNVNHFNIQTSNITDIAALNVLNDSTGGTTMYASQHIITGANSENVAGLFQATGGTLNYAIKADGYKNWVNYPTSTAGLSAGDMWVDTTGGFNIVKVV